MIEITNDSVLISWVCKLRLFECSTDVLRIVCIHQQIIVFSVFKTTANVHFYAASVGKNVTRAQGTLTFVPSGGFQVIWIELVGSVDTYFSRIWFQPMILFYKERTFTCCFQEIHYKSPVFG